LVHLSLLQAEVNQPLGTGPFKIKEWREGVYLYLVNNEHFFGRGQTIAGRRLGPYIKGLLFKVYGISDAAILALRKGAVDMYWNGIQPGYLKEIEKDPKLKFFTSKKSALYFFGFNLRKKPFSDLAFRKAVAYLIDKEFIIHRILQNYGMPLASVIPPGNLYYYCPRGPIYGQGMTRKERLKKACEILSKAGYSWDVCPVDAQGNVVLGSGIMDKEGKPIEEFTILTPPADYDPNRAMSGMMIQQWLRQAGFPVVARPMAFSALIQQVKWRHDFDCFVLGYGRLSLDPSYLRSFFHSSMDRKRGWNMSGFKDKTYDELAEAANSAMIQEERKELVCRLQEILMTQVPYIPLYNPLLVEGVRNDRFKGWVSTTGGIGNIWSICEVKPVP
jgi:ABC-type transport system substrate-binding protein